MVIMLCSRLLLGMLVVVLPSGGNQIWKTTGQAPNGYAPAIVECPSPRPAIRIAESLSPNEMAWLQIRRKNTLKPLRDFLGRANIREFDTDSYIDKIANDVALLPNFGIAVSGGGYRALMNGAGALAAFDARTHNSTAPGQLGGILQASTYLSALSGGSWLVGSLYVHNFTTVESIVDGTLAPLDNLWRFDHSVSKGPPTMDVGRFYEDIFHSVRAKRLAGFITTITDYWGRALSYQLVNASDGGPEVTFSSIANNVEFMTGSAPMPIVVAVERPQGKLVIPENSTVFEFNPWEMGSYDFGTAAFAPLRYVGSNFTRGMIPLDEPCFSGVDNAGFIMGTSSSLFNEAFLQIQTGPEKPNFLKSALKDILKYLGNENKDVAIWPISFHGFASGTHKNLTLVDGGEDLQNIPFHPLLFKSRKIDTILAVDSSADTSSNWPNGTALVATYRRSTSGSPSNNAAFPPVPDQNTFVNLGLNTHPTFFGCNDSSSPLIVYIPNAPYTHNSNVSTSNLTYSNQERNAIIRNGYNVATMGNGTVDSEWPACLGCAILSRSLKRTGTAPPGICDGCFNRYCWNGTVNSTTPIPSYNPTRTIASSCSRAPNPEWASFGLVGLCIGFLLFT